MKTASAALVNKLKTAYDVNIAHRVIAEWNLNRYSSSRNTYNGRLITNTVSLSASTDRITTGVPHGLFIHNRIRLGKISLADTGVFSNTTYFVKTVPSTTTITLAETIGGVAIEIDLDATADAIYFETEDYDEEAFPLSSIALPDRPIQGIVKARTADNTTALNVGADGYTITGYSDIPGSARFYTSSVDAKYKYWSSPHESSGATVALTTSTLTDCAPAVVYPQAMWCNKIVVGMETSYCKPVSYTIQITTDGTTWTTIGISPAVPADGRVQLYRQANGAWTATVYRDNPIQIKGVKLVVSTLNTAKVFFSLIELSPRLEADLSDSVVDYDFSYEMSDSSFVTPIGRASSNTGSITLMDVSGKFIDSNPNSLFYGLLDRNVEFRVDLGTNIGTYMEPQYEWTRLATMKSNIWSGQDREQTVVELVDDAVRLQSMKPLPCFYEQVTVGEILWRMLDSVGFNNYTYTPNIRSIPGWATCVGTTGVFTTISEHGLSVNDQIKFEILVSISGMTVNTPYYIKTTPTPYTFTLTDTPGGDPVALVGNGYIRIITTDRNNPSTLVPYFWTSGEKTIWEVFDELTQATQTAVFFDEYNVLHIMTRNEAFDTARGVDWVFNAEPATGSLPDLVDFNKDFEYEGNVVNVGYQTTKISDINNGVPVMETVWEPGQTGDDSDANNGTSVVSKDLVLRAAPLITSMSATDYQGQLDMTPMASWPFAGIIQIEGEFIRYTKKGYCYYDASRVLRYVYIESEDEKKIKDKLCPELAYKNKYTGWLYFGIENRGLWNSVPKAHSVDITGYLARFRNMGGAVHQWSGGISHDKARGCLRMASTTAAFTANTWYVASRSNYYDQAPYYYGTRLMFPTSGYTNGSAGIMMGSEANDSGYFFEITRTKVMASRKYTNELCFYAKYSDGHIMRYGPNGGKGNVAQISEANWYDIDILVTYPGGGNINFKIAVNGVHQMTVTVPSYGKIKGTNPISGRFGLFTRGSTIAYFEYLYASTYANYDAFDEEGYFDRISGGYQSSQLMREWTYSYRRASRIIKGRRQYFTQKYDQTIIDEFGPVAHEVREYEVKFSKSPVVHSNLYNSNDTQIICPEYSSDAFGAKFIIANTSRSNAVGNGEDTLTFGADNSVTQHILIYGRTVTAEDEKVATVRDNSSISRRGEVAVDIKSPWIQTEAAAKSIGQWIIDHWAESSDEATATVFGNPLLQIGDLVAINYPALDASPATHKYFIVKVDNSYSEGLETTLTLRRARI